jgi:hypothetical protein
MRDAVIAESMAKAEVQSGPTMVTHGFSFNYGAYVSDEYLKDAKHAEDLTFALGAKDRLVVGSPNDCLEQLLKWKEAIRPDCLILRLRQRICLYPKFSKLASPRTAVRDLPQQLPGHRGRREQQD